ncbi:feruloyl esterase [Variovorax sp. TBS-050B]|uniref:tannase/feruloyl esterase family alpha/beta hydrolase n=1 Tax=Variovorax sp. TBS-050B TaxID=2940551 RepID=UPI00247600E3|nr:tannase/feruloyl esterase family alpha/beta hydrolase [Variovorax sp. TBS-050B]MDH6594906.1 feruloyl esterase [Variovorax sp. TBS-050B]
MRSIPETWRRRIAGLCMPAAAAILGAGALAACSGGPDAPLLARAGRPLACELASLQRVGLDRASVDAVQAVPAGSFTPPGARGPLADMPAFCRVQGTTRAVPGSAVRFELWAPLPAAWNGKLLATGNGGYSPALKYEDMALALRRGYATLGGDTGHGGEDLLFVVGHPQRMVDWGTSSVHDITVAGKALLAALQARPARRSYFHGCSTGGHQGYAEVQRYPADFDGVIAGAPGNNRVALNAEFLNRFLANHASGDNQRPILTRDKLELVTRKAVAACDALDGVRDGVIADPRACDARRFDAASLRCSAGAEGADCLGDAQLAAVRRIYAGAVNPRTGETIYPGPAVGSEAGWAGYLGTTEPARADFWRHWVFGDPGWDWWRFDFDRHMAKALAKVGPAVDQTNPDIAAFKARGGKLITYMGWADPVVSPHDTIAYYEKVAARQGSLAATQDFFRLFMVPGMGHCGGGTGPTRFGNQGGEVQAPSPRNDLLAALDAWVEQGRAPEALVAHGEGSGAAAPTRLLCAYPKQARHDGAGPSDRAAHYDCR